MLRFFIAYEKVMCSYAFLCTSLTNLKMYANNNCLLNVMTTSHKEGWGEKVIG